MNDRYDNPPCDPLRGIHHITAVAGDPARNWRFYTQVLGERMVKKTVNFDDPGTYHLYYGDHTGTPGTILTFFPWAGMQPGRTGSSQVTATAYAVADASLGWWAKRLAGAGVKHEGFERFGESGLAFTDPDGMPLELIGAAPAPELPAWEGSPVPPEHRLHGFHSATLTLPRFDRSRRLLTEVFGLTVTEEADARTRMAFSGPDGPGRLLDVVVEPGGKHHGLGAGIVHHIAFRATDQAEQLTWRDRVLAFGLQPTPPVDRDYFMSIYFREPDGVLFEIATDPPGFTRDEPLEELGTGLRLPAQHEHLRDQLERDLPRIPPEDFA